MKQLFKVIKVLATIFVCVTTMVVPVKAEETIDIAIVQYVSHPSLDQIVQGVKDEFAANGYIEGKNLTIDFHNAEADINLLSTIAEQVISQNPDLIFAVTTPVSQTFQNQTDEIPIVMTGINDPIAAGLVDSLEKPGGNISGSSDQYPLDEHLKLMLAIDPNIETLGMIYTSSEDNAQVEAENVKEIAESLGLKVEMTSIASTLDMQMAAENLSSKVDAIYVGSDNAIASAFESH